MSPGLAAIHDPDTAARPGDGALAGSAQGVDARSRPAVPAVPWPASPNNGAAGDIFVASRSGRRFQTIPPPQYRPAPERELDGSPEGVAPRAPPPARGPPSHHLRVLFFIVLVLAVPAGAIAVVRWYSMDNWYVAIDHNRLAVYQGRPGGLPRVQAQAARPDRRHHHGGAAVSAAGAPGTVDEPSLKAGEPYIANLHQEFVPAAGQHALGWSVAVGRRIRWLGVVLILCFGLVIVQLTNIQFHQASALSHSKDNPVNQIPDYDFSDRGNIFAADGTLLATSVRIAPKGSNTYQFQRQYPTGALFSQIVGTCSPIYCDHRHRGLLRLGPVVAQAVRADAQPAALAAARDHRRRHAHPQPATAAGRRATC